MVGNLVEVVAEVVQQFKIFIFNGLHEYEMKKCQQIFVYLIKEKHQIFTEIRKVLSIGPSKIQ